MPIYTNFIGKVISLTIWNNSTGDDNDHFEEYHWRILKKQWVKRKVDSTEIKYKPTSNE